jgi:ABC-type dipeptide/oligopeptide/nickel transport system permease subunit
LSTTVPASQRTLPSTLPQLTRQRNLWSDAVRRFARNRLASFCMVIVIALIGVALFADVLAPDGYDKQVYSEAWQPPSWGHPMGTDPFGRDLLSRIIHGTRISLLVGFVTSIASLLIGLPIGASSAWFGGKVDFIFMRLIDVISAVPNLLLAILLATALGSGLQNVLLIFIVTGWMGIARLVRGQMLSLRENDYILAARSIGVKDSDIIGRHLFPNSLSPLIVSMTLAIPSAILGEAGLSFLGVGVNPPLPSWGRMLNEYLKTIQTHWYLSFFPALMIALTMYVFTMIGDGLQDALDPTAKE